MRPDLISLNNYLFEELERLNDDEELANDEKLDKEIKRSKAITNVAQTIINNAELALEAKKYCDEYGLNKKEVPKMLGLDD